MANYHNAANGPRGVTLEGGAVVYIEPGATAEVKGKVASVHGDLTEVAGSDKDDLDGMKKADLIEMAEAEGVDLGDASKVDEIRAAIRDHREAVAAGE